MLRACFLHYLKLGLKRTLEASLPSMHLQTNMMPAWKIDMDRTLKSDHIILCVYIYIQVHIKSSFIDYMYGYVQPNMIFNYTCVYPFIYICIIHIRTCADKYILESVEERRKQVIISNVLILLIFSCNHQQFSRKEIRTSPKFPKTTEHLVYHGLIFIPTVSMLIPL